ncbi:MAG: hypothetical protein SFT94_05005 [Pseudanabaenaceae cyanobacterium bins.68]|nr:hypothetical protein [Pseudanabaenaceae cyanobacterium bins.68]
MAWLALAQASLAQTFFVPPSSPQTEPVRRQSNPPPSASPSKPDPKIEEIPSFFRDRTTELVNAMTQGQAVDCKLSIQVRNLAGRLIDTTTPWRCRIVDLGGKKQVETVIFERLVEVNSPRPDRSIPTYVYLAVGARKRSQTALARQNAQAAPRRFFLPFELEGQFGVAAN